MLTSNIMMPAPSPILQITNGNIPSQLFDIYRKFQIYYLLPQDYSRRETKIGTYQNHLELDQMAWFQVKLGIFYMLQIIISCSLKTNLEEKQGLVHTQIHLELDQMAWMNLLDCH